MNMPIVSLNNMAMNESVAATCCYSETYINGVGMRTTLNGGIVDSAPVYSKKYHTPVTETWMYIEGDYVAGYNGEKNLAIVAGEPVLRMEGKYVALEDTPFDTLVDGYEYCKHNTDECTYWEWATTFEV